MTPGAPRCSLLSHPEALTTATTLSGPRPTVDGAPGTIFFFYSSSIFFCPSLRSTALTLQPPAAS